MAERSEARSSKLGLVERSILEYVLATHLQHLNRRASVLSLLLHSHLLALGARPVCSDTAVIDNESLNGDPIRLSYVLTPRSKHECFSSATYHLQLSVAETDSQIFVSLTDTTTDKFGHLELSGVEHVRLKSVSSDHQTSHPVISTDFNIHFPLLDTLLDMVEKDLISPVLPSPPLNRSSEADTKRQKTPASCRPNEDTFHNPVWTEDRTGVSQIPDPMSMYGRSDLDVMGGRSGGIGGMLMDPRRPPIGGIGSGSIFGGPDLLPPGSVPPGARFDPFGPGVMPPQPANRPRHPDPDHALPPGYEDMFL